MSLYDTALITCKHTGLPYINDEERLGYTRAYLYKELGISDTRCGDLAEAINLLHKAMSKCDYANMQRFFTAFEGVAPLLVKYGELEDMNTNFANSKGEVYK